MSAEKPFHNPFGALKGLVREDAALPAPAPAPVQPAPDHGAARPIARAVVRMERAGRGGKDVTIVSHLGLAASEQSAWLKALKATLGCGGSLDGEAIVLQGDHRERLPAILTARGVKKVTIG